ncbi:serine O-acetyltransferase [Echinicola shivajiensis]|uniref:serine O-acetyltransferase n=1 Tax=Echinicola shivajiensis TaxID=1035916 RepID=UPI001BFC2494|nr:serine acetyltransferase [Echinicola shivajiensis]
MIQSKVDYLTYLERDLFSKFGVKKLSIKRKLKLFFYRDWVWEFQKSLRRLEYVYNCRNGIYRKLSLPLVFLRYKRLSVKLGFTIPINTFGPGLAIVHQGTIIVNSGVRVGANCRIHTCVNIGTQAGYASKCPIIGDNCYIGPGAKLFGDIKIASNIAIGANAVVNKSFLEEGVIIAGVPAKVIGKSDTKNFNRK